MARKYSKKASADVERAMKKRKAGTLKSGRSSKTVKSRKQAIAIGLSEASAKGKKVPKKAGEEAEGGEEAEDEEVGSLTVIAIEAKQSSGPKRSHGLLRRFAPRNDG